MANDIPRIVFFLSVRCGANSVRENSRVSKLAIDSRRLYSIDCGVRLPAELGSFFTTAQADELYRIAQAAITNAVRHGRATRVAIEGRILGSRLLDIADNGEGIAVLEPEGTSMGLCISCSIGPAASAGRSR